jgi:cytochrome c5
LVLGLVLAACGAADEPPADLDGKALVEERCTQCHGLQNVTGAKKSRDGWQSNVERMIGKGAQLNDAEKAAVIDYLAEAYPE